MAPGTFGSALGVGLHLLLAPLGAPLYLMSTAGFGLLGVACAGRAERLLGSADDGRIVIDEVAGQLLGLAPLAWLAAPGGSAHPLWLVTGFVAFRVLDIWKPGPVRWAERTFAGGAGVVLDDVVAGGLAALLLVLLIALAAAAVAPGLEGGVGAGA